MDSIHLSECVGRHAQTRSPNALEGTSEPRPRAAVRRFHQSPPPKELVSGLEFNKGHIVGSAKKLSSKVSATFQFFFSAGRDTRFPLRRFFPIARLVNL